MTKYILHMKDGSMHEYADVIGTELTDKTFSIKFATHQFMVLNLATIDQIYAVNTIYSSQSESSTKTTVFTEGDR